MSRCIYCDSTGEEANFNDEHVIPRFLSRGFEPLNPVLQRCEQLVCENCNSRMFSGLENILKEDTLEGLYAQQHNLRGKNSVRLRGQRLDIESVPGFGDGFFSEMFPFLRVEGAEAVVDFKPQIKIRNFGDGYQVFLVDALRDMRHRPTHFANLRERLSRVRQSDISIFTGGDSSDANDLDEIIDLLSEYGINYNERERQFVPLDGTGGARWEMNFQVTIDRDISRVLSKIMFNYFAFCALQTGQRDMIFHESFDKIRSFIIGDESISPREILRLSDDDFLLDVEAQQGMRWIAHVLLFSIEGNQIIGKISLFGRQIYEVVIGQVPAEWACDSFGCGHAFNPFEQVILNLTQQPVQNPTEDQIRLSFGLFKRL